ncbi:PIN domain-like protein, partial [Mycena filopes]
QILEPAAENRSLLNLATMEGFQGNRPHKSLIIGVDISIRIRAVVAALQTAGLFHPGGRSDALVLRKLFYQLCNFSLAPLTMLFVFDGPGRPSLKRGTKVVHRPAGFTDPLKTMITHFGYYSYDAPGEAEAELGQLNERGLIDGIITEDSDAFLFGARLVVRTQGPSTAHTSLIYTMDSIENTDSVSLDKAGLILCALLLGGDYDSGVAGVGQTIAHALAALGFGAELVNIVSSFDDRAAEPFLASWQDAVRQELRTNSSGTLGRRWPALAQKIPDTFPSLQVTRLYLNPLTSASAAYTGPVPTGFWPSQEPAISELSRLCSALFGWKEECLLRKLNATVWPGVAFRMMSSV